MSLPRLVLASGSPRRREFLERAGLRFEVDVPDVDERIEAGEDPVQATLRLAIEKAGAVAARRAAATTLSPVPLERRVSELVLAADTTVVLGEVILGKPVDRRDAVRMLMALSGRNHVVLTAWCLLPVVTPGDPSGAVAVSGVSRSTVRMREVARREAEAYAAGGEPMDKAGAYAVQGEGRRFIGAISGPLDNVIGLPMTPVRRALARHGLGLADDADGIARAVVAS